MLDWIKSLYVFKVRDLWRVRVGLYFVVWFWKTNLSSEGFEVWFFQIWAWVWSVFGWTYLKFGLFVWVRKGFNFGFGGQTWVWVSSKFKFDAVQSLLFSIQHYLITKWVHDYLESLRSTFLKFFRINFPILELALCLATSWIWI